MVMGMTGIDHFELVVSDVDRALAFYRNLGVEVLQTTPAGQQRERCFLNIGDSQQVNVVTAEDVARLGRSSPAGGGHLCLVWDGSTDDLMAGLTRNGVVPRRGPGRGWGALGEGISLFVNDPDSNSVEIIVYPQAETLRPRGVLLRGRARPAG
jgi:catechol 2,3-dioxygenase-like lactoylglutathione lyase family enzyme